MSSCPDEQILETYLSDGGPSGSSSAELQNHLTTCPACHERLAGIRANLRALSPLRRALGAAGAYLQAAPARIGGYRILRELGRGGMGVVYLAEQEHPRRQVAVKALRPEFLRPDTAARFRREALALGYMQHPGIARVIEAGVAEVVVADQSVGRQPCLSMEYADGLRIDDYARRHALDAPARLALLAEVADAVHHAHLRGVIHRDLKPGNILVVEDSATHGGPPAPRARVLDFGVARITSLEPDEHEGPATRVGQLIGTWPYMSPEQRAGDPAAIDARSDVYSLGVIARELLTGHQPAPQPSATTAGNAAQPAKPRLRDLRPRLPSDVETILTTALAPEPSQRYTSAAEFAADIRRFLRHEPISARPASAWYSLSRFARRNRVLVASAGVAGCLILAATAASLWQAERAWRAERLALDRLAEVEAARNLAYDNQERAEQQAAHWSAHRAAAAPPPGPR